MEEESDESNYYNSNKIYENGNNNIFSNLSKSDDPIPILIKSPKTARNKFNFNKSKIRPKIQYTKRKNLDVYLLNKNIQKYKSSPEEFNILMIDNLINLKESHLISVFKDNIISANENEFLRGSFNLNDCIEVLPKFYDYYRNYLMFFCKPTFNNFYINETIQEYGEKQAEVYYKNNYVTKRQKAKMNNIDDKNIEDNDKSSKLESSDNNSKNDNETSFVSFRTFFSNSVESMIKKGINSMKKKEEKNKELSSIKPVKNDSEENTIYLPDNSTVSIEDIITKKSSIKNIIDLMQRKKIHKIRNNKKDLSNHKEKEKEIKKKGIIIIDKKKLIEGRNLFNRKRFNSFSKTTLNILDKNKKQRQNSNLNLNTNNNKPQPNSNYLKYAGVFKQNKYIKINNIPKIKVSSNDLILSPLRNIKPRKKSFNKIPSFKTNENICNFNLTTRNQNINNLKNSKPKINNNNIPKTNKINLPLKIKNFYRKIKNITNNSNSSIQSSICKTTNNRNNSTNPSNKNKNIINRTNYNFNKNRKYIKKSKVLPLLSPNSKNNLVHNKSLSYSTINNCNININNNIILSNNYIYNNKYLCLHNSQKQLSLSNNNNKSKSKEKNVNKNNNTKQNKVKKSIPLTSRNIKINLDKFKTEQNLVNTLIHQGSSNKIIIRNRNDKNENNIQYTSFRKATNKEVNTNNNNRNLFKIKKINNNKYNKNLVLKDTLTMNKSKSNLNKNDSNSITHTYKSIYIKNSSSNNQRKIIFDYKNKYI